MYHKYLTICVLSLALFGGAHGSQCDDCVKFFDCPVALDRAQHHRNDETKELFRKASCGLDLSGRIPLVCCSVFTPKVESEEDKLIAGHESLKLLPNNCGAVAIPRIVGGRLADLYEFPWMALIAHKTRDDSGFKCGGSIINKRYILTAAHCVKNKDILGVRVGEYNIDSEHDCQSGICETHLQDLRVEKTIIHENYKGLPKVVNDIALIRVAEEIDFGHKNVDPICLPTTSAERQRNLANVMAIVSGWGFTETGEESSILLKVKIPIHPAENCSSLYNRYSKEGEADATANQLCAGTQNRDSCNGDSGGPLFTEDFSKTPQRYVQYGIVSFGPQKCGSAYPAVYTDVRKYVGWILDHITA